jgi:hypothetical protein
MGYIRIKFISQLVALVLGVVLAIGCSKKSGTLFSGVSKEKNQVSQDISTEASQQQHSQSFELDPKHEEKIIEYLLILDNSSSMEIALTNATNGIKKVIEKKSFALNSRISTMTTMVLHPTDHTKIHAGIPDVYDDGKMGLPYEPGYLNFTRDYSIERARDNNPKFDQDKFSLALCTKSKFSPYATHPDGHLCLDAAMQTSFIGIGVEDGLTAIYQLMIKRGATVSFRPGSEVHIIFISDIHAPGVGNVPRFADFFTNRPSNDQIVAAIKKSNEVERVVFHALAPNEPPPKDPCAENAEQWSSLGTSYFLITDQTGGLKHNICATEGYPEFFARMVEQSNRQTYTIELAQPANKINSFTINGEPAENYKLLNKKKIDFIFEAPPNKTILVEVGYH